MIPLSVELTGQEKQPRGTIIACALYTKATRTHTYTLHTDTRTCPQKATFCPSNESLMLCRPSTLKRGFTGGEGVLSRLTPQSVSTHLLCVTGAAVAAGSSLKTLRAGQNGSRVPLFLFSLFLSATLKGVTSVTINIKGG